jgi:ketosteroid isomerase-like protein
MGRDSTGSVVVRSTLPVRERRSLVHTQEQIEAIVADVFRRLSSNGQEPVGESFTEDGRYEGAYPASPGTPDGDNALIGAATISKFFHEVLPELLSPFSQWADTIYPVTDGQTAIVEGRSHGTATHDGSTYENKYVWVMRFRDGRIEFMCEYFNVIRWYAAIGPHWHEIVDRVFSGELPLAGRADTVAS